MGGYACRQEPDVLVFTLLEDEELLCDFCDVCDTFIDFRAVDANVPFKADFMPSLWSLVVAAWGDVHGHLSKLVGPGSGSSIVKA